MKGRRWMKVHAPKSKYIYRGSWYAWAAGFFDGEGYVGVRSNGGKGLGIQAMVVQKDLRPLKRFKRILRTGKIYKTHNGSGCSTWQVTSSGLVLDLYEKLAPYLAPVKQEQFRLAFKKWLKAKRQYGRVRR